MKYNLDTVLENALKPSIPPSSELNRNLLDLCAKQLSCEMAGKNYLIKTSHGMAGVLIKCAKVAVILIAVLCVGTGVVYAASKLIQKVFVTEHTISVGNPDYVDLLDAAIAEGVEEQPIEDKTHEDGDQSVNWLKKEVQVVGGYATNTYYTYQDYETAISDAGLDNWFNTTYTEVTSASYVLSETVDFTEKSVNLGCNYHAGSFFVSENIITGNVASDIAHSIQLKNTNNVREYKSAYGYMFTLVDEIKEELGETITTTFVMVAYDDYYGYISFNNLSEEEIKGILDTVIKP